MSLAYKNKPREKRCDHPECKELGEFPAPKDHHLKDYHWFCFTHARAYNKQWNFYKDMSEKEIEQEMTQDITWHKPTWRWHKKNAAWNDLNAWEDSLNILFHNWTAPPSKKESKELMGAFKIMALTPPVTLEKAKEQYKKLAKKYHPDATGGNKKAEEKFKNINNAYQKIKEYLKKIA